MKHGHDENMEEQPSFSALVKLGRPMMSLLNVLMLTDANVCLAGGEGAKTNNENTEASFYPYNKGGVCCINAFSLSGEQELCPDRAAGRMWEMRILQLVNGVSAHQWLRRESQGERSMLQRGGRSRNIL